jgi:hypothetical protein
MSHSFTLRKAFFCGVFVSALGYVAAQQSSAPAVLSHVGEDTVVTAQGVRPLSLALTALSEKFGWVVDYEDPVYSASETTDAAVPEWKSQHPGQKGLLVPSGIGFSSNLVKLDRRKPDQGLTLETLVREFNESPNSGNFHVVHVPQHRWAVSGRSRSTNVQAGILDAMMRPNRTSQVASEALQKLVEQCGSGRGTTIQLGIVPNSALTGREIDGYQGKLSCRDQLERIIAVIGQPMVYDLFYDIGSRSYYLSIVPAHRIAIGADGKPVAVPL